MDEQEVQEQPMTERCENHGTLRAGRGIESLGELRAERPVDDRCEQVRPEGIQGRKGIREVSIKQLNYGYIVGVGCHNFAFETPDKLIEKLGEYLKDPQGTENKWFKGDLL
jgi:hypothetical protein